MPKKRFTEGQEPELFGKKPGKTAFLNEHEPLASRMRPVDLDEFIGQGHILAQGSLLRKAIEADRLACVIFFGPPGTGKTTLATCISKITHSYFEPVNAVTSNVEELRACIKQAKLRLRVSGQKTILFIDEIHRFSKSQQDVLMPDIEDGSITLIGATVGNPFFALTAPLLSRSLIFEFHPLSETDILEVLTRAIKDRARGLGDLKIECDKEALEFLAHACEGDARRSLNALEIGARSLDRSKDGVVRFTLEDAQESIQKKAVVYGRDEDGHYDTISAFIKSMRGSDPDATLYWLAKMLYAGEDPRFIARRICICASEDVGNADPQALVLANAALSVSEFIGMPEARIPLAQAAVYVACCPKSNAAYLGIEKALREVKEGRLQQVPVHLKDATLDGERLGHGEGYKYAHDFPGHYVKQEYMPEKIKLYEPQDIGYERKIKERMKEMQRKQGNG
ncbi:MAG TPA: AAA family ATPase [Candidatus Omnitrophica bacterium]|nr:AAA family ATPase [Candidatus Omnitrophota bacterium]